MDTRDRIILKLEDDLKIRRYSEGTIKRYEYVVKSFLKSVSKEKEIKELNEKDAIEYLKKLTEERKYKSSSYNNVNAILKFFLEVTLDKNIGYKRMPNAKLEVREKVIPEKWLIMYIIYNEKNIERKCWYYLAYGSGLRTCEIAKLKVKDIDSTNMKINVIGKGNKERITVLSDITLKTLREYIKNTKIRKKEEYLFPGQGREYITESTISRSFSELVRKLRIEKGVTIHALRRSFATHLLRDGVDIETVKELMGHNSITTTSSYSKVVYREKQIKNPLDGEF